MNIDYLNRVGTAHQNFKTYEMRLNEENQNLKKEIKRLNNIINKAIEELENAYTDISNNNNVNYIHKAFQSDLLDILKGVD